ncbi:MAG: DUF2800 domain-containing protein [Clostridiales bacterium]|nr:DUF2800 domain-containing protein [Clostridiales bacterium]
MADHALLSASSSHRWLACPPSVRACEGIEERASPYAHEGTDAHSLCEFKLLTALGKEAHDPREDMEYLDPEMEECTDEYRLYVMSMFESAKGTCRDPILLVEERLDFSRWVPEGFGTGDVIIVADNMMHIIDFKYGLGVLVSAEDNSQMRCYALGALDAYDGIYDIDTVKMSIFQPRRGNLSTTVMSKADLLEWADTVLAPTAKLAYEGGGEFSAGDHCRFCRIKESCRKRAEYNLEMARYDFQMPDTLKDTEIAAILPRIDELVSWADDVKKFALRQALSGVRYDGYKVVEGRSISKYTDDTAVIAAVTAAGYDPYEKKLLGITAMSRMLGNKKFKELLGDFIHKPPGKPVLVPDSDRRPEMNTAKTDFQD